MANFLENQLLTAAQMIERQLDQQLDQLDNVDSDDLKSIREQRLKEMKDLNCKKQEWLKNVGVLAININFYTIFMKRN